MLKIIGRTLAVLAVAGVLSYGTSQALTATGSGTAFGGDHHEHDEHHDRPDDANSITAQYPALGVAVGFAPTLLKLSLLGVGVVQGRRLIKRTKVNR